LVYTKAESDGGVLGRDSEPPFCNLGGLGSTDHKCILDALRAQKTRLVAVIVT